MNEEKKTRVHREMPKIGEIRLRYYHEEKGLTQTELGKLLDLNWRTISAYENGVRIPPMKTAMQISRILGVPVDKIFPV